MSPQPVQTLMSAIHMDHPISAPKITIIIIHVAEAGILISQEWIIVQLCATKNAKYHQSRKQEINLNLHLAKNHKAWKELLSSTGANVFPTTTHFGIVSNGNYHQYYYCYYYCCCYYHCLFSFAFEPWDCLGLEQKLGTNILHEKFKSMRNN